MALIGSVIGALCSAYTNAGNLGLPVAAYVPAVTSGSMVSTSGQLPMVSGSLAETGKVGEGDGRAPVDQGHGVLLDTVDREDELALRSRARRPDGTERQHHQQHFPFPFHRQQAPACTHT